MSSTPAWSEPSAMFMAKLYYSYAVSLCRGLHVVLRCGSSQNRRVTVLGHRPQVPRVHGLYALKLIPTVPN